ncbi:MAG: hypothetical protein U0794_03585 [Isosphaeraceae bacterium]
MLLALRPGAPRESDERLVGNDPATAMITGLSALLLEAVPEATPQQLRSALIGSDATCPIRWAKRVAGFGVPNGPIALELLKEEVARSRRASQDRHAAPAGEHHPTWAGWLRAWARLALPAPCAPGGEGTLDPRLGGKPTQSLCGPDRPSGQEPQTPRPPAQESSQVGPSKAARPAAIKEARPFLTARNGLSESQIRPCSIG